MQSANPFVLVGAVATFFERFGGCAPTWSVHLRCNSSGRRLKLESRVVARLVSGQQDGRALEVLRAVDEEIDRHLEEFAASSSITVMVNERREMISATALLRRAFDAQAPTPSPAD